MNDQQGPAVTSPVHMDAWVAFVRTHSRIMRRLSDDLDDADEVPLGTYDVLVQLSEAGGQLRLKDLLVRVLLSQPGLSRKVERLQAAGLVERLPDPTDGRGVIVTLTPIGLNALRSGAVVHMGGIARDFSGHLSEEEAAVLKTVFDRMMAAVEAEEEAACDAIEATASCPPVE